MASLWAFAAAAQAPHEVLVLVNRNSPDSLAVANHFVFAREIPPENVVELDFPDPRRDALAMISRQQFHDWIWAPARDAAVQRGIWPHVRAWVYSAGFPLRVGQKPALSLTGFTFSRGTMPSADQVKQPRSASRLFAGPMGPNGEQRDSLSLALLIDALGTNAPMPSMVLGHTGARGNRLKTILETIDRGVQSDYSHPGDAHVYFVMSDDIRSTCRQWQYPAVVSELDSAGLKAREVVRFPTAKQKTLGILSGKANLSDASRYQFVPGAMAEHLTSHAGGFWVFHQTKLNYWLRKGATASCGTVTEPLALWPKFPHARFFVHYAKGCSMLECFMLSVASPSQLLLMGEPLARPFAVPIQAAWGRPDPENPNSFQVHVSPDTGNGTFAYRFLVDGRPLGSPGAASLIDVSDGDESEGEHMLRAVVTTPSRVRGHTHLVTPFTVGRRRARLEQLDAEGNGGVVWGHPVRLAVECDPSTERILLKKGETVLETVEADRADAFEVPSDRLGLGPSPLHVEALLPGGRRVRSNRLWIRVIENETPLEIAEVGIAKQNGGLLVAPDVRGVDPILEGSVTVYHRVAAGQIPQKTVANEKVSLKKSTVRFTPNQKKPDVCLIEGLGAGDLRGFTLTLGWNVAREVPLDLTAGMVFNYEDQQTFDFFGLYLGRSWVFATYRNAKWQVNRQWAMPVFLAEKYSLTLAPDPQGGVTGCVAGHTALRWDKGRWEDKPVGLLAQCRMPTIFTALGTKVGATPIPGAEVGISVPIPPSAALLLRAEQGGRVAEWVSGVQ